MRDENIIDQAMRGQREMYARLDEQEAEIQRLRELIIEWVVAEGGLDEVPATMDRLDEWDAAAERFRRAEAALREEARRD